MALSPKERALAFIFLRRFKITILEDDWRELLREYKCYLICKQVHERIRAERETRLYK